MSEKNNHVQETIRKAISEAMKNAASEQKLSVHADAVGFVSQRDFLCVNTPITGIEKIGLKNVLDAGGPLDDKPIMFWYLSGEQFAHTKRVTGGYYIMVAHGRRGTVTLQNSKGEILGEGILSTCVSSPPKVAYFDVSASVDSFKSGKHGFKVCGHVTVEAFGCELSVSGCIEVEN